MYGYTDMTVSKDFKERVDSLLDKNPEISNFKFYFPTEDLYMDNDIDGDVKTTPIYIGYVKNGDMFYVYVGVYKVSKCYYDRGYVEKDIIDWVTGWNIE